MANELRRVARDNDWDIEAPALSELSARPFPMTRSRSEDRRLRRVLERARQAPDPDHDHRWRWGDAGSSYGSLSIRRPSGGGVPIAPRSRRDDARDAGAERGVLDVDRPAARLANQLVDEVAQPLEVERLLDALVRDALDDRARSA